MQAKFLSYIHVINALIKRMGNAATARWSTSSAPAAKSQPSRTLQAVPPTPRSCSPARSSPLPTQAKGVRVSAFNPGLTLTERPQEGIEAEARQQGITMEEALTRAKATRPLGRIAEPSEIADAVVYLASNRASYITGAVVSMDEAVTPMVV